jgi:glutamate racemase
MDLWKMFRLLQMNHSLIDKPVLFLDSGIGGLPYLNQFRERNPGELLVYAADRENFPYGFRSGEELTAILEKLLSRLIALCRPKLAVLACNTASVSALGSLRKRFPSLPLVGTVPAVKPAVLNSRTLLAGVLGTERTIAGEYIRGLALKFNPPCRIMGLAAPDLVRFVENDLDRASPSDRLEAVKPYIEKFRNAGADGIVLGCTHFLFLLDEFKNAAGPDMEVYDSLEGVAARAENLLKDRLLWRGGEQSPRAPVRCFLTGGEAPGAAWERRAERFGLSLALLDHAEKGDPL